MASKGRWQLLKKFRLLKISVRFRYLNPAAVALLRMEMFGSAERPYKSDEKNFAAELLNLGDETYDYFTDEWRFRLPSKQVVITWRDENDEDEDV
jgi:dihydrofolate reductase